MNFLFFLYFYQYTALGSRAFYGHQMYSGGSVVAYVKLQQLALEIPPTPPLIFTGGG